jgi:hypothetical protein
MRRLVIVIGVVALLAGCTRAGEQGLASGPSSPDPSGLASAGPSPSADESPQSDAAVQHAIELRRSLGLRSDLAWVKAVAADPRATSTLLAIPLLPDEEAVVNAQSSDAEAVIAVVNDYVAGHGDEFGGVYIDNAAGARVVALWTAHLEEHEAAIRARLTPGARFAVRLVTYTERYLRGLQDRVVADRDWMASIPAVLQTAGVDVIRNVTTVSVSSANPKAPDLVEAHYGFGTALEVDSDGTGAVLIPWGKVEGRVHTSAGDPPADNAYNLVWHSTGPGACGIGEVGYGLTADGAFSLPCQQGTWTIEVTVPGDDGWRSIGEGTVVVEADRTSRLDIVVTTEP